MSIIKFKGNRYHKFYKVFASALFIPTRVIKFKRPKWSSLQRIIGHARRRRRNFYIRYRPRFNRINFKNELKRDRRRSKKVKLGRLLKNRIRANFKQLKKYLRYYTHVGTFSDKKSYIKSVYGRNTVSELHLKNLNALDTAIQVRKLKKSVKLKKKNKKILINNCNKKVSTKSTKNEKTKVKKKKKKVRLNPRRKRTSKLFLRLEGPKYPSRVANRFISTFKKRRSSQKALSLRFGVNSYRIFNNYKGRSKLDLYSNMIARPLYKLENLLFYLRFYPTRLTIREVMRFGYVYVNGEVARCNRTLVSGDIITFDFSHLPPIAKGLNNFHGVRPLLLPFIEFDPIVGTIILLKEYNQLSIDDYKLFVQKGLKSRYEYARVFNSSF